MNYPYSFIFLTFFFCLCEITKKAPAQKTLDFLLFSPYIVGVKTSLNGKVKGTKSFIFFDTIDKKKSF